MSYKVGIDIGSTTLKIVILNQDNQVLYKSYDRHLSDIHGFLNRKFAELSRLLTGRQIKVAITGSAGLGVANRSGIDFVQEVFATAEGVRQLYPQTDVVIELGGEDAKILFLQGALEERMNSTCAGGTGVFIDQMATLLNVSLEELDRMSLEHATIYPIASRCGVFAKTDIQALMNQGAQKEDIAASIFQAVVSQTISGLAQGRPIAGNILFLGGPLAFLKGLQQRFVRTLKLDSQSAIFPEMAQHFVALSCAYHSEKTEKCYTYEELMERLSNLSYDGEPVQGMEPLFRNQLEYDAFVKRHAQASVEICEISSYEGDAYLGIDAGSTTTKVVLTGQQDQILYTYYCSNLGNPLQIIKEVLEEIFRLCGSRIRIVQSAVTGYGEDLIRNAFGIDIGVVETVAHYTAASHFNPEVDFIIDIGGQDIKCFQIKDHAISSVMLNEACSSGCGSFLETFAKSLGYTIEEFVKVSLFARQPVDLGTRCTVFMNSSVKQAQKNGAAVEDIAAGLAVSVVKNAIYKVIRARSMEELGKNIVVQGGTFLNDAVLRGFEMLFGRNVIRPTIAGLMGAYGAALYAKKHKSQETTLLSTAALAAFTHSSKVVNCGLCTNHCKLTVNTFANGNRFISGNRCERPVNGNQAQTLPNLFEYKLNRLLAIKEEVEAHTGSRGRIGLPLVLNMYENLPFWTAFFANLDFGITVSDVSSRKLHAAGEHTIPSDTVCYPAKLVHGHMFNLFEKGVDTVFYPCMSYNFEEKQTDNHFNCPVVAYYPEVIESNVTFPPNVRFLYPYLDLSNRKAFSKKIFEFLKDWYPDITLREVKHAADAAYKAYGEYRAEVAQQGSLALAYAKDAGKKAIILAGRPYHIDPEINHGIDKLISSLGLVILSEDSIADLSEGGPVQVLNQWTYHARMYKAAYFAAQQKDIQLVQLISFGCGIDAVTSDEVNDILRTHDKLYTAIKIDEIHNLGAVKIRLRSLLAAMDERG